MQHILLTVFSTFPAQNDYAAGRLKAQKTAGLCIDYPCDEEPVDGMSRCQTHLDQHNAEGKIIRNIEDIKASKESVKTVCKRKGCDELCYDVYIFCEDHYLKDNAKKHEHGREVSISTLHKLCCLYWQH